MKVVVKEKKEIHLMDGPRFAGATVDLPEKVALRYLEQGAVERYETKVVREAPFVVGQAAPSSALQAAPASPEPTPSASANGAKKRGRPRKASL